MQIVDTPSRRLSLDFRYSLKILPVVQTVSEYISKIPQRSFQRVRRCLLFCLLKGRCLALTVLDMTISNILMLVSRRLTQTLRKGTNFVECTISKRDTRND